jgi:hypothetical protein
MTAELITKAREYLIDHANFDEHDETVIMIKKGPHTYMIIVCKDGDFYSVWDHITGGHCDFLDFGHFVSSVGPGILSVDIEFRRNEKLIFAKYPEALEILK